MTISSAGLVTVKAGVDDSFNSGLKVVRSLNGDSIFMNCKGGSANFNSLSNSGVGLAYKFLTNGTERLGIGTAGTVTINKPQDTTTGTPFSSAALKLLPSGTQNTTGLTSIALSTSVSDNYGFLISGHRAGSSGTPTMRISSHNNSSTGTEVLNINNAGLAKFTGDTQIGDGYVTNYVKHVAGLDHTIAVSFTFPSQATRWVHHLIELRMAMGSDGATAATPTFVRYAIASNTSITAITQMDANLGGDISVATSTSGTTLTITFTEANSYAMNSVTAFATLTAGHGDAKPTGMTVA